MDKIEELLTRGVDKIYPSKEELEKVLRSGKRLKLYQGFDPTGTELHIGHMIGLRKLRQWQDLDHHVIFLIGDGTGQAGDPKKTAREKVLTREELRKNAVDYVKQAGKIVRFEGENPVEVLFNGDWLNKLDYTKMLDLLGHFSLQQLSERDLFQERIKKGEEVNMREFIYPTLQGYDSVAMDVDLEIGGSDQTFNMLCGRALLKKIKNKDKFVMTTPLLTDSKGQKIGKTEGNVIALTDHPNTLFNKIMSLPDDVIIKGFEYLTDIPMSEVKEREERIKNGENPIDHKMKLANEIVKQLSNTVDAENAQKEFERVTRNKELPTNIELLHFNRTEYEKMNIIDLLVKTQLATSKSHAKLLVKQGGVEVDNEIIKDTNSVLKLKENMVVRVGRKFVKIKVIP